MLFQAIIPNTGDAKVSTTRKSQFKALQNKIPETELDTTYTNKATIYFGSRISLSLIDTIQVLILVGTIKFHDVDIPIPIFLYLKDMDKRVIYFNNIIN